MLVNSPLDHPNVEELLDNKENSVHNAQTFQVAKNVRINSLPLDRLNANVTREDVFRNAIVKVGTDSTQHITVHSRVIQSPRQSPRRQNISTNSTFGTGVQDENSRMSSTRAFDNSENTITTSFRTPTKPRHKLARALPVSPRVLSKTPAALNNEETTEVTTSSSSGVPHSPRRVVKCTARILNAAVNPQSPLPRSTQPTLVRSPMDIPHSTDCANVVEHGKGHLRRHTIAAGEGSSFKLSLEGLKLSTDHPFTEGAEIKWAPWAINKSESDEKASSNQKVGFKRTSQQFLMDSPRTLNSKRTSVVAMCLSPRQSPRRHSYTACTFLREGTLSSAVDRTDNAGTSPRVEPLHHISSLVSASTSACQTPTKARRKSICVSKAPSSPRVTPRPTAAHVTATAAVPASSVPAPPQSPRRMVKCSPRTAKAPTANHSARARLHHAAVSPLSHCEIPATICNDSGTRLNDSAGMVPPPTGNENTSRNLIACDIRHLPSLSSIDNQGSSLRILDSPRSVTPPLAFAKPFPLNGNLGFSENDNRLSPLNSCDSRLPSMHPILTPEQWDEVRVHECWLLKHIKVLTTVDAEPPSASAMLSEEGLPSGTKALSASATEMCPAENLQEQHGTSEHGTSSDMEVDGELEPSTPDSVQVNAAFVKEIFRRFSECEALRHLPSLNLVFTLPETILMCGTKRAITILLNKATLPKLLEAMQYNPKLNSLIATRPKHTDCLPKRVHIFPIPQGIADLAQTVYTLQYLKDVVIPVVCENRYEHFNAHLASMKCKLCHAIFHDRRLLPRIFQDLMDGELDEDKKIAYLRFIRELLELWVTAGIHPVEAHSFWKTFIQEYKIVLHLTSMLAQSSPALRRVCIDITLLLCDEECRKVLVGVLSKFGDFLRRLFDLMCDYSTEEATLLQLKSTLPMLVANADEETLGLFYEAASTVSTRWLDNFSVQGGPLPPRSHITIMLELLSPIMHHHCRTAKYIHTSCVTKLIDLIATLWSEKYVRSYPKHVAVALNKGVLSILHFQAEFCYHYMVEKQLFKHILLHFNEESNTLLTSSILTLLHTILQLNIQPLINYVNWFWFFRRPPSPAESSSASETTTTMGIAELAHMGEEGLRGIVDKATTSPSSSSSSSSSSGSPTGSMGGRQPLSFVQQLFLEQCSPAMEMD